MFVLVENDIATIHSACIKETVIPKFDHVSSNSDAVVSILLLGVLGY